MEKTANPMTNGRSKRLKINKNQIIFKQGDKNNE